MKIIALAFAMLIGGCTAIRVSPVDADLKMRHVCIENNPAVTIKDFLPVLRDGIERHGISTELYQQTPPDQCKYLLSYTARRSWDIGTYLSQAELRIDRKGGGKVAEAHYHLRGKGGYSLLKWQGVKTKMDPVIDELLTGYRARND